MRRDGTCSTGTPALMATWAQARLWSRRVRAEKFSAGKEKRSGKVYRGAGRILLAGAHKTPNGSNRDFPDESIKGRNETAFTHT